MARLFLLNLNFVLVCLEFTITASPYHICNGLAAFMNLEPPDHGLLALVISNKLFITDLHPLVV